MLLLSGRLLSAIGSQVTAIAYPLLVLAVTHSPAKAGLVGFAGLLPHAVFGLPAGVAVDRWNRKRIMVAADGVRAVAIATLATLILLDEVTFWHIAVVALVEGTGAVFFTAAHAGALRAVVPAPQLPAAVGVIRARAAAVMLAGPPLGGVLFALGRAVPFVFDAISYAFSFLTLALMRTPFQQEREVDRARLRTQVTDGFRFLWRHPFLRTCALIYGLGNFTIPAVLFVIVVAGRGRDSRVPGSACSSLRSVPAPSSVRWRRRSSVAPYRCGRSSCSSCRRARDRRVRRLAERLRADGGVRGAGDHAAGDRLRRRGLSNRDHPGSAARPSRDGEEHDLAAGGATRAAVRRASC